MHIIVKTLCCTTETNAIAYVNYTSIKKKKLKPNGNAVEPLFGFLEVWDTEPNKVSIFKDYII